MRLIPASYNGFALQQGEGAGVVVATTFPEDNPYDWDIIGITTNKAAREQDFPVFTSKNLDGSFKTLSVWIGDIDNKHDEMVIAMDVLGSGQHQLIANDIFGRAWYINAVCLGKNTELLDNENVNKGSFIWIFETDDPIWKKVIPSEKTISVGGSGTEDITPLGNQPALPIITITPSSSGSSGFRYQKFVQVINNSTFPLVNYPLNIAGTVIDTAALISDNSNKALLNGAIDASVTTITYDTVTGSLPASGWIYIGTEQIYYASRNGTQFLGCVRGVNGTTAAIHADNATVYTSKMAADGNDLRVYVDGVEVKRWLSGINTVNTKIWINQTQPANSDMTLGAAIAGAGAITEISIQNTATNNARLALIPTSGNVLIGSEIFVYTGVNLSTRLLTGVTRAERQTSAGAHAVSDAIKFVTHDIWLYYGDPVIDAYVVDDTYKPAIELTSTNSSWVYADFGNFAATRTGGWAYGLLSGSVTQTTGTSHSEGVDPFTAIGFINVYDGIYTVAGVAIWKLFQPCGISTITETGKKIRNSVSGWTSFTFEKSLNDSLWTQEWKETAPTPLANSNLDSHSAVALGGTYPYIRFKLTETVKGDVTGTSCRKESRDVTLVIVNYPTVTLGTEQSIINLHSVFENSANGYEMTIDLVMNVGEVLIVNTLEKTITSSDGTNRINALKNMPVRPYWFPLEPNEVNTILITDINTVTYDFSYEDRTL